MNAKTSPRRDERRHAWNPASRQFVSDTSTSAEKTHSKQSGFIKGPLPLDWMRRAATLPGKALHVALTLWYLAGLQKTLTVRLASKPLDAMGVSRDAKYEALARLATAGLLTIEQKPGQAPVVTIQGA